MKNENVKLSYGEKFGLTKKRMKKCTLFAASSIIPDIIYLVTGNEFFEKLGFYILSVGGIALIIFGFYLNSLDK